MSRVPHSILVITISSEHPSPSNWTIHLATCGFEPSSTKYKTYLDAFPVGPDIPVGELVNELHQTGDNSLQTILWEGREGGGRHELFRLVYFPFILSHKAFSSSFC